MLLLLLVAWWALGQVESQPGMLFVNSVSAKNEMFNRLHEDPLLLIKQNELKVSNTSSSGR